MSVLTGEQIQDRLKEDIRNPKSLVITPIPKTFDYDSVDLRLGCYFRLPEISSTECIRPYSVKSQDILDHYSKLVHKPYRRNVSSNEDSSLILQPQHSVLASTLEYIKMPGDVSGQILTKSSWARIFITIESAPWIHPFFRGCLTLEITNLGNVPIALPVGKPIAQLVLESLKGGRCTSAERIKGNYVGAITPEAPRFPVE